MVDHLLKEFKDIFEAIGNLPGGPYQIQLKEDCKVVQNIPHQVAVSLKTSCNAEVHRPIEWISPILLVKKLDGSLKLCLDPKNLNKTIQ